MSLEADPTTVKPLYGVLECPCRFLRLMFVHAWIGEYSMTHLYVNSEILKLHNSSLTSSSYRQFGYLRHFRFCEISQLYEQLN